MIFFKLLIIILFISTHTLAENIYQYTNKSGNLVIGNISETGKLPISTNNTVPQIQSTRRKILVEELHHEIQDLKSLLTQKSNINNSDITKRQNNINRLTKQLNQEG